MFYSDKFKFFKFIIMVNRCFVKIYQPNITEVVGKNNVG